MVWQGRRVWGLLAPSHPVGWNAGQISTARTSRQCTRDFAATLLRVGPHAQVTSASSLKFVQAKCVRCLWSPTRCSRPSMVSQLQKKARFLGTYHSKSPLLSYDRPFTMYFAFAAPTPHFVTTLHTPASRMTVAAKTPWRWGTTHQWP